MDRISWMGVLTALVLAATYRSSLRDEIRLGRLAALIPWSVWLSDGSHRFAPPIEKADRCARAARFEPSAGRLPVAKGCAD